MNAPLFHMNETSGEMTRIVKGFLDGNVLDLVDLNTLRFYVYRWVVAMPRKPCFYKNIPAMSQEELMSYYHDVLLELGIDPF